MIAMGQKCVGTRRQHGRHPLRAHFPAQL